MPAKPNSFHLRSDHGVDNITVEAWGPHFGQQRAADIVAAFYLSTWGDPIDPRMIHTDEAKRLAQLVADGKALPNALESISMTFSFNGISRATTHQLVRTRVGASFGQQGGRDNDWSDFNLRFPPTFEVLNDFDIDAIDSLHIQMNQMYLALLSAGIPTQDARYVLPMGLETALVGTYNLLSLKGTLQRRLCNRMMWETNYVARCMADLAVLQYPWLGRNLRASCQKGICSSVSPMFPPADLVPHGGSSDSQYAADNTTLQEVGKQSKRYDYPQEANGCYLLFDEIDRRRIAQEHQYLVTDGQVVCISLVDGETVLTKRDEQGLWRKHNG